MTIAGGLLINGMTRKPEDWSLRHSPLKADIQMIRRFFSSGIQREEIRNPHPETPVAESVRQRARSSAVLLPIVDSPTPSLIVTKRQAKIRFGGHVCFPGGLQDDGDLSLRDTAMRETEEEINLDRKYVEILGELGPYYTQAGYRITPVVALVSPGFTLKANPDEVDQIYEISFDGVLDARNYRISWHGPERGHMAYTQGDIRIAGPTVSVMVGFYEALQQFNSEVP